MGKIISFAKRIFRTVKQDIKTTYKTVKEVYTFTVIGFFKYEFFLIKETFK